MTENPPNFRFAFRSSVVNIQRAELNTTPVYQNLNALGNPICIAADIELQCFASESSNQSSDPSDQTGNISVSECHSETVRETIV